MSACRNWKLCPRFLALDLGRITDNPEVIGSSFALVPTNALVLTRLLTFRVVGNPEVS